MSIATRGGDDGSTALMYGRRVPKDHPRVRAYGAVDELTAALGLVRAALGGRDPAGFVESVQRDLIPLMAELAVDDADRGRFEKSKLPRLGPEALERLDAKVEELEAGGGAFTGWAIPGANEPGARLELARTVCRRAERELAALAAAGSTPGEHAGPFLNRLADVLWLLARQTEKD
jgi:cob(I)alamin adenosyltransferase